MKPIYSVKNEYSLSMLDIYGYFGTAKIYDKDELMKELDIIIENNEFSKIKIDRLLKDDYIEMVEKFVDIEIGDIFIDDRSYEVIDNNIYSKKFYVADTKEYVNCYKIVYNISNSIINFYSYNRDTKEFENIELKINVKDDIKIKDIYDFLNEKIHAFLNFV